MCGFPGPPPAPRARQRCPGNPFPRGRRRTLTRGSSSQHKLRILCSILRVLPAPSASSEATKSRCSARPHLPKTRPGAPCTSFPRPPGPSWGSRQLQLFLPHLPAPQGQAWDSPGILDPPPWTWHLQNCRGLEHQLVFKGVFGGRCSPFEKRCWIHLSFCLSSACACSRWQQVFKGAAFPVGLAGWHFLGPLQEGV